MPVRYPTAVSVLAVLCLWIAPAWLGAQDLVRPGDWFVVRMSSDGSGATALVVDDRTELTVPSVGRVSVAGLSPRAAVDTLYARLLAYRTEGAVAVSYARRVFLLGDVRRPDVYHLDPTLTLRGAIVTAGGVSDAGRPRVVLLRRNGEIREITDWRETAAGDIALQSGDEIIVPRERWVKRNALALLSGVGVLASVMIAVVLN